MYCIFWCNEGEKVVEKEIGGKYEIAQEFWEEKHRRDFCLVKFMFLYGLSY